MQRFLSALAGVCRQEAQDPVTEGGVEPEVPELHGKLGGHNGVE